jgi:hypothetical protein
MLHGSLPLIAHRLRLRGGEGEATQGRSDLLLQTADLLAWAKWTRASRDWLESQTQGRGAREQFVSDHQPPNALLVAVDETDVVSQTFAARAHASFGSSSSSKRDPLEQPPNA